MEFVHGFQNGETVVAMEQWDDALYVVTSLCLYVLTDGRLRPVSVDRPKIVPI